MEFGVNIAEQQHLVPLAEISGAECVCESECASIHSGHFIPVAKGMLFHWPRHGWC